MRNMTTKKNSNPGKTHYVGDSCKGGHENLLPIPTPHKARKKPKKTSEEPKAKKEPKDGLFVCVEGRVWIEERDKKGKLVSRGDVALKTVSSLIVRKLEEALDKLQEDLDNDMV